MADQNPDFAGELNDVEQRVSGRIAALESKIQQVAAQAESAVSGGSVFTAKSVSLFLLDEFLAILGDGPGTVTHEKVVALRDRISAMA